MDSPNFPTCHPSTNGLSHTQRTFRKIYQPDTPRQKWTRPTSPTPQLPLTCHPSTNGNHHTQRTFLIYSATLSAHFVIFNQPDTPRKKWTRTTSPSYHPSTNGVGHSRGTFRKINQPSTPRQKWTRPTSYTPNFPCNAQPSLLRPTSPTCHPSTSGVSHTQRTFLIDSATLSAHFVKLTNLTHLDKNGLAQLPIRPTSENYAQLPPPATPQQTESATLSAHFVKCTELTPLGKMDSANVPYLPPLNYWTQPHSAHIS